MKSLTSWKDFNNNKSETLTTSTQRMFTVNFDSYTETEKAWIIVKNKVKHILPKSKTTLSKEDKTLSVPVWLYVKVFTEDEDLAF